MEDLNINLNATGGELIIRQGDALPQLQKRDIQITGNINSPFIWYIGKKDNYDWKNSFVLYDRVNHTIKLIIGDHSPITRVEVTGKIEMDSNLQKFGINRVRKTTLKEMVSLIKMNRIHFLDRDANMKLVSNLKKFKARVTQEIEDGNDFKGNKKQLFEQKVTADLDLDFKLHIPLFKGSEKMSFSVDINFDITDGSTMFWLESVDMNELIEKHSQEIMGEELGKLKDLTIIEL